jgi:hypothetical protein
LAQIGPIELDDNATWSQAIHYALAEPGVDQQIDIVLFRGNGMSPYRRLQLWVNVRPE